jgi:hypothetical protein
MATLPSLGTANPRLFEALKQLSAAKYGRPKADVEKEINSRMATLGEPLPKSSVASTSPFPAAGSLSSPASTSAPALKPAATAQTSFLDDWLSKRQAGSASTVPPPQPSQPFTAAPAPPPSSASPETNNISSNELEQAEVDKIAAELKQQLDTPDPPVKKPSKTEHTMDLSPGQGDTIFIDREGQFQQTEQSRKT